MNPLVRFALGIANMPAATTAELDAALPGFQRLADAAKELEPIITQAQPLLAQALPHVNALLPIALKLAPLVEKAMPIVQRAYPDVVLVTPAVDDLIAFVRGKQA